MKYQGPRGRRGDRDSSAESDGGAAPGRRTMVERVAGDGVVNASSSLPHAEAIQKSFGHHDVSKVRSQVGGAAADASTQLGATAYASGNAVGFAETPDLRTAAHEAAHVVQQRAGLAPASGAGEQDDAFEENADRVADAVVAGQSAEPVLDEMVGGRTSAAPNTAVQLSPSKLRGIDLYLRVNETHLWRAIANHLSNVPWPSPHPQLEWTDPERFGLRVASILKSDIDLDEPAQLLKHLYPANHRDTLAPMLTIKTDTWFPAIGRALAELFEDAVRSSLRRLGPRWAAAAEHDPTKTGSVEYDQLIKSHPMDRQVGAGLVTKNVATYIPTANKPSAATAPRKLREVKLEWQGSKDPSLWNWVKADPADAIVEEVAASLHSAYKDGHEEPGSVLAYGMTPAPPLFGLPPSWARTFSAARKHAPVGGVDVDDRNARLLALAQSSADDDIALAQSRAAKLQATSTKSADLVTMLGDSLIAAQFLQTALSPYKQGPAMIAAIRWLIDKQARIATVDEKELGSWAPIIQSQKDRLIRIASGVKQVTDLAPGMGIKDASSPNSRPINGILGTYAQAAALSHLADTSEQLITDAAQQQQQLAIQALRSGTNDLSHTVGEASRVSQAGVSAIATETDTVTAASRALQNQLATGTPVDGGAIEETTLRAQELAFQTRVEGLYQSMRALGMAVMEAGSGLASHIASRFHGSFRTIEDAVVPIKNTLGNLTLDRQSTDQHAKGKWEDPSVQRRFRRDALVKQQKELGTLNDNHDLVEFLKQGADTVKWQRFATACVQALAMIGIAIVAGAAGGVAIRTAQGWLVRAGATEAVAGMAGAAGFVARGAVRAGPFVAGAATEATLVTAGQTAIQGGNVKEAFLTNLLTTMGSNAIIGRISKDLDFAKTLEKQTAGIWAKAGRGGKFVLKETASLTAHTIMNVALGHIAHRMVVNKTPSAMEVQDWFLQGVSAGIGKYAGKFVKARKPMHEKLGRLPELATQRLLPAGDELALLAQTAETKPSGEAALDVMAKRKQLLDEELKALEVLEKNPDLLRAHPELKLTLADIRATAKDARVEAGAWHATNRDLVLKQAGLEEIVSNSEFRGSKDQIDHAIESARKVGLPIGQTTRVGTSTHVVIAGQKIIFHEGAATASAPPIQRRTPAEQWLEDVRSHLSPDEQTKLQDIIGKRSPEEVRQSFKGDVEAARASIQKAAAKAQADQSAAVAATVRLQQIRDFAEIRQLNKDPRVREVLERFERKLADATDERSKRTIVADARKDLRSIVVGDYVHTQLVRDHGGHDVRRDVQVWQGQDLKYKFPDDFKRAPENVKLFAKSERGVKLIDNRVHLEITDVDFLVLTLGPPKTVVHSAELKTGKLDTHDKASKQLDDAREAVSRSLTNPDRPVRLLEGGKKDITAEVDLGSFATATHATHGPEGKGFDKSLKVPAKELETFIEKLFDEYRDPKPP